MYPGNATYCGTPGFIAPEVQQSQAGCDERADMYSWGMCWFSMVMTVTDVPDSSQVGDGIPCL